MKRVATAVVLIPLVLLAVFKAPPWLFVGILGAVALLALHEYLGLAAGYGAEPVRLAAYCVVGSLFAALALSGYLSEVFYRSLPEGAMLPRPLPLYVKLWFSGFTAIHNGILLVPLLFLLLALARRELRSALPAAAASSLGVYYVAIPLMALVSLRSENGGAFLVFYTLVVVWAGDIFAYYVGRAVGRHKLAPEISPGKTWEGAIASFLASVVLGSLLWHYAATVVDWFERFLLVSNAFPYMTPYPRIPSWLVCAAVTASVNVSAQFGDLVESMIKRGAAVKDSGTLLPGHGGILDRVDALLFAAPVVWYYAAISTSFSIR